MQLKAIDTVSNEFDDTEIEQYRQKLLNAASPTPSASVKIHSTKELNESQKKHVQRMLDNRLPVNDINVFIEHAMESKNSGSQLKEEDSPLELSVLNGSTPH